MLTDTFRYPTSLCGKKETALSAVKHKASFNSCLRVEQTADFVPACECIYLNKVEGKQLWSQDGGQGSPLSVHATLQR